MGDFPTREERNLAGEQATLDRLPSGPRDLSDSIFHQTGIERR